MSLDVSLNTVFRTMFEGFSRGMRNVLRSVLNDLDDFEDGIVRSSSVLTCHTRTSLEVYSLDHHGRVLTMPAAPSQQFIHRVIKRNGEIEFIYLAHEVAGSQWRLVLTEENFEKIAAHFHSR